MKSVFFVNLLIVAAAAFNNSGIHPWEEISPGISDEGTIERRTPLDSVVHVVRETNGDRFRRGEMSPMKPSKRNSALMPRASPAPACRLIDTEGRIQVNRASDGSLLGYVRQQFDGQNSYTYGSLANSLKVSIPVSIQSSVPFEFRAINGPDAAHPFVGAVGGSGGYNFNAGQLGYAYLSGTGHTPANSPPSFSAGHSIQSLGYNAPAESTVWMINCLTLAVTAQWTNVDGSQPSTSIFYDPSVDFLALIGDFDKFTATFPGEGAFLVTLQYIPG